MATGCNFSEILDGFCPHLTMTHGIFERFLTHPWSVAHISYSQDIGSPPPSDPASSMGKRQRLGPWTLGHCATWGCQVTTNQFGGTRNRHEDFTESDEVGEVSYVYKDRTDLLGRQSLPK